MVDCGLGFLFVKAKHKTRAIDNLVSKNVFIEIKILSRQLCRCLGIVDLMGWRREKFKNQEY